MERYIFNGNTGTVTLYSNVIGVCICCLQFVNQIGCGKNMAAVDCNNFIADLQAGSFTFRCSYSISGRIGRFRKFCNRQRRHFLCCAQQNCNQQKSQNQIHKCTGKYYCHSTPDCFFFKSVRIVTGLILAFHGTESTDWKQPERIFCFTFLKMNQFGSHANCKLIDLNVIQLCNDKMSKFVNADD